MNRFVSGLLMLACIVCANSLCFGADPFSIQRTINTYWLLDPAGQRFFSFGVCCVEQGTSQHKYDPRQPSFAAFQHYPDSNAWAEAAVQRLQSWGFTTIGGWSDYSPLQKTRTTLNFTPVLHVGSTAGLPWWDMWHPTNLARSDDVARANIVPLRDDPRLMGYYADNEVGWWNSALFKMTLEQSPDSQQRRLLLKLLREKYGESWDALLKDFDPEGANSWPELNGKGVLYLRAGGNGIHTVRRFVHLLAKRYYELMRDMIQRYDQRGLLLGDRYQSFYFPEVAAASKDFVDAVSSNLNASWNDGTFPRFYLETLHALTGKPIIIGEFYMAARQNRSGNQNNRGIFPVVDTQRQRAIAFQRTASDLVRLPYVLGADWFQYFDEPTFGRGDGENYNFGLIDIQDQPYCELTRAASRLNLTAQKQKPAQPRLDARSGIPRAPKQPFADFKPNLALKHWDRERGFVPPISDFPLADLYLCWSANSLYVGLYAQDVVETGFYRNKSIPDEDRARWTLSFAGSPLEMSAVIGAGKPATVNPELRIQNISGVDLLVRNIAAIEVPASLFGKTRFKKGDSIRLNSTFLAHCAGYRTDWSGSFTLR